MSELWTDVQLRQATDTPEELPPGEYVAQFRTSFLAPYQAYSQLERCPLTGMIV